MGFVHLDFLHTHLVLPHICLLFVFTNVFSFQGYFSQWSVCWPFLLECLCLLVQNIGVQMPLQLELAALRCVTFPPSGLIPPSLFSCPTASALTQQTQFRTKSNISGSGFFLGPTLVRQQIRAQRRGWHCPGPGSPGSWSSVSASSSSLKKQLQRDGSPSRGPCFPPISFQGRKTLPGPTQGTWLLSIADSGHFYSRYVKSSQNGQFPCLLPDPQPRPPAPSMPSHALCLMLFIKQWDVYPASKCSFLVFSDF